MAQAGHAQGTGLLGAGAASLRPALAVIGVVLLARVVYTVLACPYDLVEDEAHYWLWSRHLDWSYYSKGPGIAWAIRLSTGLLGHAEWAVRLPTVLASAVGALACAGLARDMARRAFVADGSVAVPSRAALFAAAAFLLAPAFQLTGVLVTIDGCYLACWACACWAGWRAMGEASRWAWPALGAAVAVGFLFKYTILLLVPGLVLFALIGRAKLRLARGAEALAAVSVAIMLTGLTPVLVWNAREGWPTVRHLVGHLGLAGGDVPAAPTSARAYSPAWTLEYLAAPLGMFGPCLALGVVAALRILRRRQATTEQSGAERRLGAVYLVCCASPILLFYLGVSFIAEPEQNWAIAGFVTLLTLAGWYGADELARRAAGANRPALTAPPNPRTRVTKVLWRLSLIYGLCAVPMIHRSDIAAAALNRITASPAIAGVIRSIRGADPAPIVPGRLIGAKRMAEHAGRMIDAQRLRRGADAAGPVFLIAEHYGRASQMAYYLNRPVEQSRGGEGKDIPVFSAQSILGGRKSQFDLWPETSLAQPWLRGGDALLLSNDKPRTIENWGRLFDRVEPVRSDRADDPRKLEGEHKKDRVAFWGLSYRGLGAELPCEAGRRPVNNAGSP
ncbi:MAG: ArnT family glycosyltransferase [Phycisphaerales bacterium]